MQPIGPFFLFLFLPVSLLFIALAKQQRAVVTSLFSLLYVVLLNLHTPIGLFMMAAVILLARLATLKPLLLRARPLSLFLGVLLPLSLLVSARVLLPRVAFPFGITVLTLLAISTVIDACRDGYVPPKNVLVFAGTLCFFPLLAVGPLVRGKDMTALFGDQRITLKRVFDGIRLYTLGAIHIYIVAAPLYFIYQKITETFGTRIDIFFIIVCPLLIAAFLLSFLIGMQQIARGLALICGITLPCDRRNPYRTCTPALFFSAWHLSLGNYLKDYIVAPITALTGRRERLGRLLSVLAIAVFLAAAFSPRTLTWQILLALTPALCLLALPRYTKNAWSRTACRVICTLIIICVLSISFMLPIISTSNTLSLWRTPADTLSLIVSSAFLKNLYYLSASILCLSPLIVIVPLRRLFIRHVRHGARVYRQLEMLVLMLLFAVILLYFMPRFPALSTGLLANLLL